MLGELDRSHPNSAGSGVDQDGLAVGEVPRREQALVRGPERDRHGRGAGGIEPVGDRPGHDRGGDPPGGVRAGEVQRHHPVADSGSIDAGRDLAHNPGTQIADDVGRGGKVSSRACEQIPSLDADRLGVDHHAAVRALGIGYVLVAEHVGSAVLVDHRRLHTRDSR